MKLPRVLAPQNVALGFILVVAFLLRAFRLGRLSLWYDEVVTMTLARARDFPGVLTALSEIDATRAPLHPLLLHVWVLFFGGSELSGRSFSVACGVLSVFLIHRIARRLFNSRSTALFAAWLSAVSPMLILYSREARMYSWLVLVTCAAWDALVSLRDHPRGASSGSHEIRTRYACLTWYGVCLIALGYSHPLGLFMALSLAFAARGNHFTLGEWLIVHLSAAAVIAVWVGRYLDHPPELVMGRLPIRYLLGTPIGWTGGNFLTLGLCLLLVCAGLFTTKRAGAGGRKQRLSLSFERPDVDLNLLVWLVVPVALLWAYSLASHPIFGPARYTLFCAPPYLILMARGMARLPRRLAAIALIGLTALAALLIPALAYAPDLKADWRAAAAALSAVDPSGAEAVLVTSNDPAQNLEVVTARYYLGQRRLALALPASSWDIEALRQRVPSASRLWLSGSVRNGWLAAGIPAWIPLRRNARILDVNGLRLIAVEVADLPMIPPRTR